MNAQPDGIYRGWIRYVMHVSKYRIILGFGVDLVGNGLAWAWIIGIGFGMVWADVVRLGSGMT